MNSHELITKIDQESLKPFFFNQLEYEYLIEHYGSDCGSHRMEDQLFETEDLAMEFIKKEFGEVEAVDQRCDSDEFWSVIHFKDHDIYLKFSGWFNSYDMCSHHYDADSVEVFPKQITKIVFE